MRHNGPQGEIRMAAPTNKKGWFSKIESRADALKVVKETSTAFYVLAAIQAALSFWPGFPSCSTQLLTRLAVSSCAGPIAESPRSSYFSSQLLALASPWQTSSANILAEATTFFSPQSFFGPRFAQLTQRSSFTVSFRLRLMRARRVKPKPRELYGVPTGPLVLTVAIDPLLPVTSERRATAMQRFRPFVADRWTHGLGHFPVIQAPKRLRHQRPVSRYCRHSRSRAAEHVPVRQLNRGRRHLASKADRMSAGRRIELAHPTQSGNSVRPKAVAQRLPVRPCVSDCRRSVRSNRNGREQRAIASDGSAKRHQADAGYARDRAPVLPVLFDEEQHE